MRRLGWLAAWLAIAGGLPAGAQEPPVDPLTAVREAKDAGDLAGAKAKLEQLLTDDPANADGFWMLAWINAGLGDRPGAMEAFSRAAQLLPPTDPRYDTAQEKVRALRRELRPLPPERPPVEAGEPPRPRVSFWSSWPARLLALVLLGCAIASARAVAEERRLGPHSPAARFADLCLRAHRGEAVSITRLFELADADRLSSLPDEDLALAVNLAAERGNTVLGELAEMVRSGQGRRRRIAAGALARQKSQPDPTIWRPLLTDDDRDLRRAALTALRTVPDAAAAEPLRAIAAGDDARLAPMATAALAAIGGERAAELLGRVAAEARLSEPRLAALAALAGRQTLPAALVRPLTPLLRGDEPTRLAVVAVFAAVGDAARKRLLAACLDPADAVRRAAREALLHNPRGHFADAGPDDVAALLRLLDQRPEATTEAALDVALAWSPAAARPLVERALLAGADTADRQAARGRAIAHLTECDDEAAGELLQRAAESIALDAELEPVTVSFAEDLATAAARRGWTAGLGRWLKFAARLPDNTALRAACRALASAAGAGEALAAAAADENPAVRGAALALLADHPAPEATEAMLAELDRAAAGDSTSERQNDAVRALGALEERRAIEPLRRLRDRADAARADELDVALAKLGDHEALRRVEAMLVRSTWAERRPAARFFRDLREPPPRAQSVVLEAAANELAEQLAESTSPETVARLVDLGDTVRPTMVEWLAEGRHRALAARVLTGLGDRAAARCAEVFDRIDALAADPNERATLALLLQSEDDIARDYARGKLGDEATEALLAEASSP